MTLRDRLRQTRHARFVGRDAERALFESALESETLPFHVIHVYGPGGIGKTTLLSEFQRFCRLNGAPVAYVDARDIERTPEAFAQTVAEAFEPPNSASDGVTSSLGRHVLLVDTYELLEGLDAWLRRTFLPEQSEELMVVLAGRGRPDPAWTTELGWQGAVRVVPLRNLTPAESETLLAMRGIPEAERPGALAFTHGHPLALNLLAEYTSQHGAMPVAPTESPDMVGMLVQRFLDGTPSRAHREALESVALVRGLSEPTLSALLDTTEGVSKLFAWLRNLSFIEEGPNGLFPHDLARDVLVADLRWRDADRYALLHERARRHYTARLQAAQGDAERHAVLGAYVFLYRDNPVVQPFFDQLRTQWQHADVRTSSRFQPDDAEALCAMVARHEGDEAATLAAQWFDEQPDSAEVFRDEHGAPMGFLMTLNLGESTPATRAADPATAATWRYLRAEAPLREGECALLFRFWMDAEAYQGISAVQSLVFARTVRHYLTAGHLAFSFLPCADPEFWASVFAFADLYRLSEADFTVGDQTYGVYGHDWRVTPPTVWLDALAQRAPNVIPSAPTPSARSPLLVLSEPDFAEAVHTALKQFARPHNLIESPLLHSRLVVERAGRESDDAERVAVLGHLLAEAAAELEEAPREAPYYRALQATYFKPVSTQALAAERLGVPFSTYRRHLKRGIEHVVEALWRQEMAL